MAKVHTESKVTADNNPMSSIHLCTFFIPGAKKESYNRKRTELVYLSSHMQVL